MSLNPITSTVGYFYPVRTGLVFRETFEDPNFSSDNNWIGLQGVAVQSSTQSVDVAKGTGLGLYSMPLANSDIQVSVGGPVPVQAPIIQQSLSYSTLGDAPQASVWFYDPGYNAATSGLPGPYLKLEFSDGQYAQIGARNFATSGTTNYVAGGGAGDVFQYNLSAARTPGWHLLQFVHASGASIGNFWLPYVDQNLSGPIVVSGTTNKITGLFLNGDVLGSTQDSFGFWDEVHYNRDSGLRIFSNNTRTVYLKDHNYNTIISYLIAMGTSTITGYNTINDSVQPAQIWLEASQADGTPNPTSLEALIRLNYVWNGDIYQYLDVVFDQQLMSYDDIGTSISQSNKAPQGQVETIVTGQQNQIMVNAHKIEGFDKFSVMQQLYQNARYSRPFSLAVSTQWAACSNIISGTAGDNTFIVGSTLGITANNLLPTYWYVIEDLYHQFTQYVQIQSIDGSTVTIGNGAVLNFDVGSTNTIGTLFFIRPTTFYPALGFVDPTKLGLKVVSPRIPRFDWQDTLNVFLYS